MALEPDGKTYSVNTSGADIIGFDPSRDRLDFGEISVHGLILGKLANGTAVIVNPWQKADYQRILDNNRNGISWNQLTLENIAPVGNEHLREDIGGVMSWDLGIGPRKADTVYIRSHEYDVHERVENFDPQTQKLNFLYLGTRERLTASDTDEGLLISVEPSTQSVLLVGVKRTDLYAGNLEFHFDQVMEDNLEDPFGVTQDDVSLVSREVLLTPQSIGGASTDGYQVRSGQLVHAAETVTINSLDHNMNQGMDRSGMQTDMSTADVPVVSNGSLSPEVSGSLYWGGMSGMLTLTNSGNTALDGWSISFVTPHRNFQSWAGDVQVEALADGNNRITLTPAPWNQRIGTGQSIEVSFNADSVGLPNSGSLSNELFFAEGSMLMASSDMNLEADPLGLDASSRTIADGSKRIVGYFEEWGIYGRDFLVQDINVDDLTHINYSFFDVKSNGDVNLVDSWAATEKRFNAEEQVSRTFSANEWAELDDARRSIYMAGSDFTTQTNGNGNVTVSGVSVEWDDNEAHAGNLRQFALLKQLNPDINLGLALGGWTLSDEFSLAFDDATGRERFTDNVITILETYNFFNTVDFDWEYPGGGGLDGNAFSDQDGANFAATLQVLRQKMDALESRTGKEYGISVATAGGQEKLANLNLSEIDAYVDFYNVMTYDFHGGWESVTGHQAAMTDDADGYDVVTAIEQFRNAGISLEKVLLGAPTYTRAWGGVDSGEKLGYGELGSASSAPGSYEAGNYDQKDLVTGIANDSYDLVWDDDAKAAYLYNDQERIWSSIETPSTIAGKAAYVDAAELGGMMFWALSSDSSGDQSLIGSASDLLRGGASHQEVIARGPGFDVVFGGDGQFNISDFTTLT